MVSCRLDVESELDKGQVLPLTVQLGANCVELKRGRAIRRMDAVGCGGVVAERGGVVGGGVVGGGMVGRGVPPGQMTSISSSQVSEAAVDPRLRLMARAQGLGNVSQACREIEIPHSPYAADACATWHTGGTDSTRARGVLVEVVLGC